jgi:hypothetical protein
VINECYFAKGFLSMLISTSDEFLRLQLNSVYKISYISLRVSTAGHSSNVNVGMYIVCSFTYFVIFSNMKENVVK